MALSTRIRRHLQSHVVGYVALFIALSGTAIALPGHKSVKADDLAKNSVRGKSIKPSAVSEKKLRSGSVSSGKIVDGAVIQSKLGDGAVSSGKLADDAVDRKKLKAQAVAGSKIADGAVSSAKVDDGSLLAADFAPGQLTDAFAESDVPNMSASTSSIYPIAYNAPRSGHLLVIASTHQEIECADACTRRLAIFVDGNRVGGSTRVMQIPTGGGTLTQDVQLTGFPSGSISQGNHFVEIRVQDTDVGSADDSNNSIAGILVQ